MEDAYTTFAIKKFLSLDTFCQYIFLENSELARCTVLNKYDIINLYLGKKWLC